MSYLGMSKLYTMWQSKFLAEEDLYIENWHSFEERTSLSYSRIFNDPFSLQNVIEAIFALKKITHDFYANEGY